MKKIIGFLAVLLVLGCGKETTTRPMYEQPITLPPVTSAVQYPLFEVAQGAEVTVAETVEGERHIVTLGDPAASLLLAAFIADEYGDERLAIRIHDAEIARYIPSIITKAMNISLEDFRSLPPEERCIGASYDAAMGSPILYRLDNLFAVKGLQVVLYEDEEADKLFIVEKEITDFTKIWFRYPDE